MKRATDAAVQAGPADSTAGGAHVVLENLTKRFGPVTAVQDANLSIEQGEFFALLGPSGCGKTTTLRLVAGLERPTSGRVHIGSRDVTSLPPRERDVAMVFQDYALYPHMTLLDNIGYPLRVRKVPRKEVVARVREVAEHLQIAALLDRRPAQVSGGQQQRAAVARALVHKPQVFLFDEPLSNLDAKLRLEARAFLKHLQQEVEVTAIYVTHDQAEALAMADRIAVMFQGELVQVGNPLEVYHRPTSSLVASFIGNPPMNLIPCRVERTDASTYLAGESFRLEVARPADLLPPDLGEGEQVLLGIRPEHINVAASPRPGAIPGHVYAVQPLGAETLITLQVSGVTVSVRLFTDQPPPLGERAWLTPDLEHLHVFPGGPEVG
ncbi:MAG: ABC transporter ATP-binding protein [Candidatus Bipolaricaulaceae bacterium]